MISICRICIFFIKRICGLSVCDFLSLVFFLLYKCTYSVSSFSNFFQIISNWSNLITYILLCKIFCFIYSSFCCLSALSSLWRCLRLGIYLWLSIKYTRSTLFCSINIFHIKVCRIISWNNTSINIITNLSFINIFFHIFIFVSSFINNLWSYFFGIFNFIT